MTEYSTKATNWVVMASPLHMTQVYVLIFHGVADSLFAPVAVCATGFRAEYFLPPVLLTVLDSTEPGKHMGKHFQYTLRNAV